MKRLFRTRKVWTYVTVLVVLMGGLGLMNVVRNASLGPWHCRSCHPHQTEQWQHSGVHNPEAQCVDCHAQSPHLLPTSANVFGYYRDALLPTNLMAKDTNIVQNCIRCHETVFDASHTTSEIVVLSHRVHLEEGLTCIDCHRNISHDTMAAQTYRPPKKVCYECHLRDIDVGSSQDQSCEDCHKIVLSREESQQWSVQNP